MNNQRPYAYDDQGVHYSQSNAPAGGNSSDYSYNSQMYQQQGGQYYAPPRHPPTSTHGQHDPRYARSATPAAGVGHRYSRSSAATDPRYYPSSGLSSSSAAPPSPTHPYNYSTQHYSSSHQSSSQSGHSRFIPTPSELVHNYNYSSTLPDQQPSQSPSMYSTPGHHSPSRHHRHTSTSPVLSTSRLNPLRSPTSPTGERYPCEICGKTFSRSHDRKRHHETQHIASPVLHRCRYCRKEFSRADSLKRHLDNGCEEMPSGSGSK